MEQVDVRVAGSRGRAWAQTRQQADLRIAARLDVDDVVAVAADGAAQHLHNVLREAAALEARRIAGTNVEDVRALARRLVEHIVLRAEGRGALADIQLFAVLPGTGQRDGAVVEVEAISPIDRVAGAARIDRIVQREVDLRPVDRATGDDVDHAGDGV